MRHHMRVRFDPLQETEIFQARHDLLARNKTVETVQLFREPGRSFGQSAQVIFVADQRERGFFVEHADLRQVVAPANFEIVEVMRWRHLDRARTLLRIGIFVGDNRNPAADQWQDHMLADEMLVAFVIGMHGHGGIAEHGLGPRGGDHDEACRDLPG